MNDLFDIPSEFWVLLSTFALTVVWIACILHIRHMGWHTAHCERFGFIFTGMGAFFLSIYPWTPVIHKFPASPLMHFGMALIAVSLVRGQIRGFLIDNGFAVLNRRQT